MEGVAEEESLKGALVGWVASSSAGQSGVPKAKVQRPESSWLKRDSDRPQRAVGSRSSLGCCSERLGLVKTKQYSGQVLRVGSGVHL